MERSGELTKRVRNEAVIVLGQRKLLQRLWPGLMHAFIFWGFLVLLLTIVHAMGAVIHRDFALSLVGGAGWFALLVDVFATLVIVGVAMAFFIRKVQRPKRFEGSRLREADFILLAILGIVLTLLAWNGTRIALGLNDAPASWSPVSNLLSGLFSDGDGTRVLERALVWAHVLLILGFLAYIPRSKHLHIVTAAINVFFGRTGPRGRLKPLRIDLEAPEEELHLGAATAADLTWKGWLDLYSCTECGRCQDVCPAWGTGKPLSPKLLIMDLRDHALAEGSKLLSGEAGVVELQPLVPNAVTDEVVWDCTTCGACVRECPVSIEHIDHIVDLRRALVMAESRFPQEAGGMLRSLETSSNPWGQPQAQRAAWADGLGVRVLQPGDPAPDYLYWIGCAGSFDERARKSSRAVAKLLQAAGIEFAILGPRELCTGDPARRMGNEYLFQTLAEQNVETLDGQGVRKVVASCPHCFNTLANEYPDYGGRYEVIHHTELLARLVREGRLRPAVGSAGTVTYHDPCYLGRHNGVYDEPRELLAGVGATVEMPRHGERSFCCGAGGARMWMEETRGQRINVNRAEEAAATGAETLAVGCPYCLVMLDDGVKAAGKQMRIADVAELLADSVDGEA